MGHRHPGETLAGGAVVAASGVRRGETAALPCRDWLIWRSWHYNAKHRRSWRYGNGKFFRMRCCIISARGRKKHGHISDNGSGLMRYACEIEI